MIFFSKHFLSASNSLDQKACESTSETVQIEIGIFYGHDC